MSGLFDFAQSASNAVAGNVGGPVDLISAALRAAGIPIPDAPMGSTEWMRRKGLVRDVEQGPARVLGETAGLLGPAMTAKFAPQIAGGLLQAGDNLMAPVSLNKEAGMIRIPGRGQIPETRSDVNKLADRFQRLLDDANVEYTHDKSGLSPARYFEFDNPATLSNDLGADRFKVRISDHRNVHGADISVDPVTGSTFEEMLKSLKEIGVPISSKAKLVAKNIVPDEVLERVYGAPISEIPQSWVDLKRKNLVLDRKGYWREK